MKLTTFAAGCAALALALPLAAEAQTFTLRYTTVADSTGGPAVSFLGTIVADADPYTGTGSGTPQAYLPTSIVGTRGSASFANTDAAYFYNNFSEFYYPATPGSLSSLGGAPTSLDNGFATLTYNVAGVDYTLSRSNSTFYLEFSNGVGRQILASNFSISQAAVTPTVPEPASWAMMIAGIGAIGYTLRRRRAAVALPASA